MNDFQPNLLPIIIGVAAVGLVPFAVITMTAFLKISVVLLLVRNALGTQQTPPTLVLYAIAIVLTIYVSGPLIADLTAQLSGPDVDVRTIAGLENAAARAAVPMRAFLQRFAANEERAYLVSATERLWSPANPAAVDGNSFIILIPAFVISELTRGFEIGFLLYLPFIAIDVVVSIVLMAMGMQMVSPLVISVPFKLFLFVMINGWSRLLHGLILSYA